MLHFSPLTWSLDGQSELHIASYPSWFPSETSHVPYLYKTVRTPATVYLQLIIRAKGSSAGPSPHITTVNVRSLAYQPANGDAVQLLTDYHAHSWMQGDAIDGRKSPPIPCIEGTPITVSIALTLNGVDYEREGTTACTVRTRTVPLLRQAMAN